ncbi:hypothetical protein AAH014_02295 [Bacteroides uniformis]|uniref:hypothetical protein n=1 Tax=Bacteroides uniformis TaxID=820 RepID=UPI0039B60E59
MKKIIILMVCLWGLGNTFTSAQTTEKEKFISSLMKQMTLDEKIGQLAHILSIYLTILLLSVQKYYLLYIT